MMGLLGWLAALLALGLLAYREYAHSRDHGRSIERLTRAHDARSDALLNRLAHAYDRPWEQPPEPDVAADDEEDEDGDLVFDLSHRAEDSVLSESF